MLDDIALCAPGERPLCMLAMLECPALLPLLADAKLLGAPTAIALREVPMLLLPCFNLPPLSDVLGSLGTVDSNSPTSSSWCGACVQQHIMYNGTEAATHRMMPMAASGTAVRSRLWVAATSSYSSALMIQNSTPAPMNARPEMVQYRKTRHLMALERLSQPQ